MGGLNGRVAIVTGATKTMGAVIAERLAADGAAVLGVGRSVDLGKGIAAHVRALGGQMEFVECDVTEEGQVQAAIAAAVETFSGLDILVNNAAAIDSIRGGMEKPVAHESLETFDWIMRVGVYGPFLMAKYAIPEMIGRGGGVVVNISSVAAIRAVPGMTAYGPSKAALESLTNQIAVDHGAQGIRAVTVRVGGVRVADNQDLHAHPVVGPMLRQGQMLDRTGLPEDIASAVAYLVSDEAQFITAAAISVDGGSGPKQHAPNISAAYAEMRPSETPIAAPG